MQIKKVELGEYSSRLGLHDTVCITDENDNIYTLEADDLERLLVDKDERCDECDDTGVIEEFRYAEDANTGPHMQSIGNKKCVCRLEGKDDDHD